MKNILSFLSKSKLAIFAIILLLIVQSYCDLSLPTYTSNILNVGLQQGGIENAVLDQVREESLDDIMLFMSDDDCTELMSMYEKSADDSIYVLKDDADRERVNELIAIPECIVYQLGNNTEASVSIDDIKAAYEAGVMTKDQILEQMSDAMSQIENLTDTYINQIATEYVKAEYEAMGIDLNQYRNDYLFKVGGIMLVMALVMMVVSILTGLLASVVSAKVGRGLREAVYEKVMAFTNAEMEQFSTASLITRSTNDIQQVQMVIVMLLRMVAYAPILAIGGIIMVIKTSVGMSWIIVLAVIILAACVGVLMAITLPQFKKMQTLVDNLNLVSRELLTGIMPIRAFSREKHEEERFDVANKALYKTQLFTNSVMSFMSPVMMFVMNGISVLIIWAGGHAVEQGNMQVGNLTAFITYAMVIVMGFLMIAMICIMLPRAGVAADRIVEVIETPVSLHDPSVSRDSELESVTGVVEFNDVSFRYPGAEEDALEHISFKAEPGRTTAIIGSTGCGKTTLVNLIPRFFDVTGGSVTLDGIDVREISQHKLRETLGFVPQKGVLFSGTINSNLKYGGDYITDEDAKEAAEIAQATEFISSKSEGYDSPIAQGGSNVSGGQKQRLSIARAIAKHPKVFIFDDSFSALDYKTDLALRQALAEKTSQATVIIVAQRISTILHADQIIVLDEGHIVGVGTHEELLNNCSEYYEIASSQLSEAELAAGRNGGEA